MKWHRSRLRTEAAAGPCGCHGRGTRREQALCKGPEAGVQEEEPGGQCAGGGVNKQESRRG